MSRRRLAGVILGTWAVTLGWLVQRHYFRSTGARLAEAALAIPPGSMYYRVTLDGAPFAFASTTIDTLADSIRVDDVLVQDVAALGRLTRTTARSTAIVGRTLRLRSLTVAVDGADQRFDAQGDVSGDSVLRLTLIAHGDSDLARVRVDRAPVVPSLLALRLAFGGALKVGNRYGVRLFDPITLTERDVAVRVAAETTLVVSDSAAFDSTANVWVPVLWDTVPSFRLDTEPGGGERIWIDAQGQVVRVEHATGALVERAAFELAYENFRHRDTAAIARASAAVRPGAVVTRTALAAGAPLSLAPRASLRLRVRGGDLRAVLGDAPDHALQGDTLVLTRADTGALKAHYLLPARDTALAEWLRSEPLIQANDARIQAQARQIVGRQRNAARATQLLIDWLATLRREPSTGVPNAARALDVRAGDCSELTVLFVALARAAGLPARTVGGLVWRGDRFYYHAWAEVYFDRWVAVDPMLGQLPADAGRVRFVVGGLARAVDLARAVGNVTFEPL